MTHLEGPIVDSLYDMALLSWSKKLEPILPSHNSPAVLGGVESFGNANQNSMFAQSNSTTSFTHQLQDQKAYDYEPRAVNQPGYEPKAVNQPGIIPQGIANDTSDTNRADILTGPSTTESVTHPVDGSNQSSTGVDHITHGVSSTNLAEVGNGRPEGFEEKDLKKHEILAENVRAAGTTGDVEHIAHNQTDSHSAANNSIPNSQAPMNGAASNGQAHIDGPSGPDAKTADFLSAGEQALPASQIQHPSAGNSVLPEHTTDDPHYDVDIAGEVARVQSAVSPKNGETRVEAVTRHLNHTRNVGFKGNAPECEIGEEMTPYIPHPVHEPFPIAMVCREPYGAPNNHSVYMPQNEVWLSALRNAKKNVFIQSPTLNAEPLVPAIVEACERGIDVYCYICLGYNDTVSFIGVKQDSR